MSLPVGPYSPSRRIEDWVVTSGQIGIAPDGQGVMGLVEGGTEPQLRQALRNLADVLGAEAATLDDVVKATVYLVDMGQFALVNRVWVDVFGDSRPARSAVGVAALPLGALVEVEAWAHRPLG